MNRDEILKFANLIRIGVSEEEVEKYVLDFSDIMKMLDQINEVEITSEMIRDFKLKNIMRDDQINFSGETRDRILKEFPEKTEDDYLKVQKIL